MSNEERVSDEQKPDEQQQGTEKPEVTDEHRERAKEMMESYEDDRPTITLPGSGGTVAGTAVNEWVDDDGNPKYGDGEKAGEGESEKAGS